MGHREDSLPEELITPEMVESFVSETNDLLDGVEGNLLELEKTPSDMSHIDEAFRYIHTVKGNAGFFGFQDIETSCMDTETVMDNIRKGRKVPDHEFVTSLLERVDSIRGLLEQIGKEKTVDTPSGDSQTSAPEPGVTDATSKENRNIPDTIESKTTVHSATEEVSENRATDGEHIPLKEEKFEKRESVPTSVAPDRPAPTDSAFDQREQSDQTEATPDAGEPPAQAAERDPVSSPENSFEGEEYKPLGDVLIDMGAATPDAIERALGMQQKKLGEILVEQGTAKPEVVEEALSMQKKGKGAEKEGAYAASRKDIRVDMGKLDRLFDLMGELITAEAMVVSHPELQGLSVENFHKAADSMSKITRAMQEITMTIRMIPLEGLFNKMRRLVRDLARKFDKKIILSISGQDTEMDRNVIEEISDPLVHIIRNAIDHGIESAAARTAAGKNEEGHISLDAKYEGNEIWITVSDDGGGLKREKIITKALDNGIISGDTGELSDSDVWQLIFEPGFSTADQVSEISGRGVGMDVVRKNIEKLRGKIEIQSTPGQGSSFIMKIPLTLAIIDGINFKVGNMQYSLPINDVVEFQKVEENQLTRTTTEDEVLTLRNEILPLIKLYRFFNTDTEKQSVSDGIIVVAQGRGKKIALLVDEIIGYRQIVIKPLPEYLEGMRAVSGCSILGNGEVTLILDLGSLIKTVLE